MKKRKIYTCLALFSVSLLTSQWVFSPLLLAEERQTTETVSDHSIHQTEVQSTEAIQIEMTKERNGTELEESFEPETESFTDPIVDSKENDTDKVISEETHTDSLENPTDWNDAALEETEIETPTDEREETEEESAIEVPETQETSPCQDNEKNEAQEEEPADSSSQPEEQANVDEEKGKTTQEKTPEPAVRDQESTSPSTALPEPADVSITPQPNILLSLPTGIYDGSVISSLPEAFRASEVAESTLLGFTLPLLSTYEEEWQAALVYEVIRQVGESSVEKTFAIWVEKLVAKLIKENEWTTMQNITAEALQPGDLIFNTSGEIEGLYLTESYYVALEKLEEADDGSPKKIEIQRIMTEEAVSIKRLDKGNLTDYGHSLVRDYPAPYSFTVNKGTQTFIDTLAIDAQRLGQEYDVFASVLIAQAILESGSGTSGLSRQPYYNLFGIKGSYQGNSVVLPTMEDNGDGTLFEVQSAFRSYVGYQESMSDYIALLRGGIIGNAAFYQDVWRSEAKNYLRATDALTGTYATDVTYNKKLNSLIAAYNLTQYDQIASTESGAFIQGLEQIPDEYRALMQFPSYNGQDYNHSGSYPVGQCTWYVFNRVHQLGGKVDDYMGNGGQWGMTGRRLGYTVSQTSKAGMMVSFTPGTAGSDSRYGHVAFVEAVGPNGILISEGNVVGGTTISYRVITYELARSNQVSYILPK